MKSGDRFTVNGKEAIVFLQGGSRGQEGFRANPTAPPRGTPERDEWENKYGIRSGRSNWPTATSGGGSGTPSQKTSVRQNSNPNASVSSRTYKPSKPSPMTGVQNFRAFTLGTQRRSVRRVSPVASRTSVGGLKPLRMRNPKIRKLI